MRRTLSASNVYQNEVGKFADPEVGGGGGGGGGPDPASIVNDMSKTLSDRSWS